MASSVLHKHELIPSNPLLTNTYNTIMINIQSCDSNELLYIELFLTKIAEGRGLLVLYKKLIFDNLRLYCVRN